MGVAVLKVVASIKVVAAGKGIAAIKMVAAGRGLQWETGLQR